VRRLLYYTQHRREPQPFPVFVFPFLFSRFGVLTMSTKDYVATAKQFRTMTDDISRSLAARAMAKVFAADNCRFDCERFYIACGLTLDGMPTIVDSVDIAQPLAKPARKRNRRALQST
jgi:hypothetical protein